MRVLLAGGTGVIGVATARQLIEAGHFVTLLLRRDHRRIEGSMPVEEAEIDDAAAVRLAGQRVEPDAIISHVTSLPTTFEPKHLAAVYHKNDHLRRSAAQHLSTAASEFGASRGWSSSPVAWWYTPGVAPAR